MSTCTTSPEVVRVAPKLLLGVGLIGLYWIQLFYQLQLEWTANAQYNYGWFIPLLAAGLMWRRWVERPALSLTPSLSESFPVIPLIACMLAFILPLRLIHEAGPGWRSAQWLHAFILVLCWLLLIWRLGGRLWVRHFAFPILFLLLAVPWPSRIEDYVVQGLMRCVAAVTSNVLDLLNVPAIRRGSLLEISTGVVGVDEACSGVRSLQTSLMTALLLGELYRLGWWRRLVLIPAGVIIALFANVGRTTFLTWSAAKQGIARMEAWHDSAGVTVVVVVLLAMWGVALLLKKSKSKFETPMTVTPLNSNSTATDALTLADRLSRLKGLALGALLWFFCIEALTAAWFYFGNRDAVQNQPWSVKWPMGSFGYRDVSISKWVHSILRFDAGKNALWQDDAGNQWSFSVLKWSHDNKHSFVGRGHGPEVCLRAAGWNLLSEPEPVRLVVHGIELPFSRYVFEIGGRTAYVFLGFWEERSAAGRPEISRQFGTKERLLAALHGRKQWGLTKLEISVVGPASADEALNLLQKELQEMLVPEPTK